MEIFFAKLFGLYFLIMGLIVIVRRKSVMPALSELANNRPILLTIAALEIAAGLGLVLAYPTIEWTVPGLFSIIGYMLIVEGLIYLVSPHKRTQKFVRSFGKSEWVLAGGVAAAIIGIYLVGYGFNLF